MQRLGQLVKMQNIFTISGIFLLTLSAQANVQPAFSYQNDCDSFVCQHE